jgi:hypothetical protein
MPCSQCVKNGLKCIYDKEKGKPGMKAGAIDCIHRRLDALENMFLGQAVLWQQLWNRVATTNNNGISPEPAIENLQAHTEQLKQRLDALGRKRSSDVDDDDYVDPRNANKRRRIRRSAHVTAGHPPHYSKLDQAMIPPGLVDALVEFYFSHIHPWIPVLHVRQFRQRMRTPEERCKMSNILQAITSVCLRLSNHPWLGDADIRSRLAESNRQAVILQSLESFSVEGLQALIICAFDTIGSGRGPSAWSIVGSMARTVEQLQLSTEDEDDDAPRIDAHALVKRMAFLPPCKDWREAEERRRVFWTVFLMDRFCSIATGWNVCLTSADVQEAIAM